jgi:hypothetical protein
MNRAFRGDLHEFRILFWRQWSGHFYFDIDSVEHALLGFAFFTVRRIDARVRERDRNVLQRHTISPSVQADRHGSAHAKRREQKIVRIRSSITAACAQWFVRYEVMSTCKDFLLKVLDAATHDDLSRLFFGFRCHGWNQGLRIPLNASRYLQIRKTNKIETSAAIGRPLGSIKM